MLIPQTIECRLVPSEWFPPTKKNPDSIAIASDEARQFLLQLCIASTHLCKVLNDLIGKHPDFETWKTKGSIPKETLKDLWNLARSSSPYKEMPERFSRSAWLRIEDIYSGWFETQKKLLNRLEGLNRWLSIAKSDQELVEISGSELEQIQLRANELIPEIKLRLEESKQTKSGSKGKGKKSSRITSTQTNSALTQPVNPSDQNTTDKGLIDELFNTYFSLNKANSNLLDQCAIVHLIKNSGKIAAELEDPEKFIFICRKKQKKAERIQKQLKARLPRIRDLGRESIRALSDGVQIVTLDNTEFAAQLANLQRGSNPLPYPILFRSGDDLEWLLIKRENPITKQIEERIFVRFKGLKYYLGKQLKKQGVKGKKLRKEYVFEVCCDRRQHQIFQQFLSDWQTYSSNTKDFSIGSFLFRSANICWREVVKNGVSKWQLYLQCTIDRRGLTSEGSELSRAEKVASVKRRIDNYEAKQQNGEKLTEEQKKDFKKLQSQLDSLNNSFSRPSKPPYKGDPNIIVGISFSLDPVATVAVIDCSTQQVLAYRSTYQLLGEEDYKLLTAYRFEQRRNANERHKQQKRGKVSNLSEVNRGKHIDRKLAKAILEVVQEFKAASLALPQLTGLRESIQSKIEAEAELRYPGDKEKQYKYKKQDKINMHRWSYRRLTQNLKERASKIGVLIEDGQQSFKGDLKNQAMQVAMTAYSARKDVGT